jgi:hypothetical protein
VTDPQGHREQQYDPGNSLQAHDGKAAKAKHQQTKAHRPEANRHQKRAPAKALAQQVKPPTGDPALVWRDKAEERQDGRSQEGNAKDLDAQNARDVEPRFRLSTP